MALSGPTSGPAVKTKSELSPYSRGGTRTPDPVINSHDLRASRFLCARLYAEMTRQELKRATGSIPHLEAYQWTSPKRSRTV
jgi:hypothetical protein